MSKVLTRSSKGGKTEMGKFGFAIAVVAAFGLAGTPVVFGYEEAVVSDGGTISGKISFKGKVPDPQHFLVQKNPELCGKERDFHFVRVKDGALQNVVVTIEGIGKGKPFTHAVTEFIVKECAFLPYVSIVTKKGADGWPVFKIENTDTVMHNPHTYQVVGATRSTLFNIGLPEKGSKLEKELKVRKGNVVKVECDQHDFMHSWTRVVEHPYFAVVEDGGNYKIDGVPAGKYKLVAWHPILGEQTQEITVAAEGTAKADFSFTGK
jgi:polysaccharide lyase family 4-like protein